MFNSNDEDKQVEFFNDFPEMSKKQRKTKFNLGKIAVSLSYENIIIVSIGLIMLLITCYSLGVERGKKIVRLESQDLQIDEELPKAKPEISTPKPKEEKAKIGVAKTKESLKTSSYIQVASFRKDTNARKEIERLKNKGYRPFLTRWGKFSVVCVGGYDNKEEAKKVFRQLRKTYADCILREK